MAGSSSSLAFSINDLSREVSSDAEASSDAEVLPLSFDNRTPAAKQGRVKRFKVRKKKTAVPKTQTAIRKIKRQAIRVAEPPRRFKRYFEAGTDEAELESVTNQEIKQLFELLKTSNRQDLRLRLGSLYIEKARLIEYRLYEKYDQEMNLYRAKKRRTKPRLNLKPIYVYVNKAIKLFETYRRQFSRNKNMDQVLFFLGVSYFKKGQLELGRKRYKSLLKRFPKSVYINDVNFELGEYYFNKYQWKTAAKYYRKLATKRNQRLYSFALYKLAWCRLKMGQVTRAMANLEAVIREGVLQGMRSRGDKGELYFAKEAIGDMVLFYGHSRRSPAKAWDYFQKMSGSQERALKMLSDLAYLYLDQGNLAGVRITFRKLIEEYPNSPMAYDYQYQIIRAHTYAGDRKIFLRELKYWLLKYGPDSTWARKNRRNKEVIKKAFSLMEFTIRNYALRMHQSYRKTKGKIVMRQALFAYELYNKYFRKSDKADQMRFFFAEMLFDLRKYTMAGEQYLYVAENFPRSKYYETASLNSVLTFEKSLPSSAEISKIVGKRVKFIPFTRPIHAFQKVAQSYISRFPKKSNVPAILYKKASLHYEFNHYKEALAQFWDLIQRYPSSTYTEHSANLILDMYNLQKDFEGLRNAAIRLLKNKTIANSGSAREIRRIVSQISLKTAEDLAKKKEYLKSAHMYKKFADGNPRSPLVETAYYNAGVNFKKSGDFLKTLSIYRGILARRPTSENKKIRKVILKEIPEMYQQTGQYLKAAEAFSNYARIFPKDVASVDFWFNAALIYDGLNRYTQAERAYLAYFKKSKKAEKVQALYLLAELKKKRGQPNQAVSYYQQFLNRGSSNRRSLVEAAFKIAEIKKARRQISQSKTWYRRAVGLYKKNRAGVFYAAEAQFQLVYSTYVEFLKIRIPRASNLQKKVVQKKLNLFNRLKEDLKQVIRFNSGQQVVASLVLIGLASEHMSDFIYNSPIPKGLNRVERKQYKEGLKKTAVPFKKESIESYRLAIKRARKLRVYNAEWLRKAVERLSVLDSEATSTIATQFFLRKKVLPVTLYNLSGE